MNDDQTQKVKNESKTRIKGNVCLFFIVFSVASFYLYNMLGRLIKKHILLKLNNIFTQFIHYLFNWFVPDQDIFHVEIVSGIIHWQGRHIY